MIIQPEAHSHNRTVESEWELVWESESVINPDAYFIPRFTSTAPTEAPTSVHLRLDVLSHALPVM